MTEHTLVSGRRPAFSHVDAYARVLPPGDICLLTGYQQQQVVRCRKVVDDILGQRARLVDDHLANQRAIRSQLALDTSSRAALSPWERMSRESLRG